MPPAAIIVGLAVAGAAAGAAAAASGKNRNDYKGDRNAPSTENGAGTLNEGADDREQLGRTAQGREGVQMDNRLGNESRSSQYEALGEIRKAALGEQPSVAELQMRSGLDQTMRNNAAMANSARGQAALALTHQNAAINNSMAQQNIAAQSSILRAQEMAEARNAWMGGAGQIRGFDEQRAGTQAGLDAQQRGLNDQMLLGLYGQAAGLDQAAVDARTQQNQQNLAVWQYKDSMDRKESDDERAARQQNFNDVMGGASAGASMGMSVAGKPGGK